MGAKCDLLAAGWICFNRKSIILYFNFNCLLRLILINLYHQIIVNSDDFFFKFNRRFIHDLISGVDCADRALGFASDYFFVFTKYIDYTFLDQGLESCPLFDKLLLLFQ